MHCGIQAGVFLSILKYTELQLPNKLFFCMVKLYLISNYSNSSGVLRTSTMELFAKIVKGFHMLTIFL